MIAVTGDEIRRAKAGTPGTLKIPISVEDAVSINVGDELEFEGADTFHPGAGLRCRWRGRITEKTDEFFILEGRCWIGTAAALATL